MFVKITLTIIIIIFIIIALAIVTKILYLIFTDWNLLSLNDQKERIKLKYKLKKLGFKI